MLGDRWPAWAAEVGASDDCVELDAATESLWLR
jgi:hypothetical protein